MAPIVGCLARQPCLSIVSPVHHKELTLPSTCRLVSRTGFSTGSSFATADWCKAPRLRGASTVKSGSLRASAASTQSAEADTEQKKREELKSKLDSLLAATNGNLTEESKEVIAQLEKLNPTAEPAYHDELAHGHFIMANSTMTGVLYKGASLTLGRLAFNQFQPTSLKVKMLDVYNDVGVKDPADYNIITLFEVDEEGKPPLAGMCVSTAKCQTVSPQRVELEFVGTRIQPRYPEKDLEAWKAIVQDGNPTMTEDGIVSKELKAKGSLDFLYVDMDLRITIGNQGSIVVVRRLPQKEVSY